MPVDSKHTQLVWDLGSAGTVQVATGCSVSVGPNAEWTPEELLLAAVESSLMSAFLDLAESARLEILGYVSAAEATLSGDPLVPPRIAVRPCVVVCRDRDSETVRRLLADALARSPVARALREPVRSDAEVVVVPPTDAG